VEQLKRFLVRNLLH